MWVSVQAEPTAIWILSTRKLGAGIHASDPDACEQCFREESLKRFHLGSLEPTSLMSLSCLRLLPVCHVEMCVVMFPLEVWLTHRRVCDSVYDIGLTSRSFPCYPEVCIKSLCFYERWTLVPVFANRKTSEENFCFYRMVIVSSLYSISAYKRFHRNTPLSSSRGDLCSTRPTQRKLVDRQWGPGQFSQVFQEQRHRVRTWGDFEV